MLIHYCVIAFKNIWKYKVSASISILGLAFALVCFVPILYWMDHETTYDSFYKDSESIYRVYSAEKQSGKVNKGASKGIENSLREQVPAIEASTTLMLSTENCRTQATPYIQMNMLYTDSTFLEVFPQSFVCGEMNHPLQIVNNMILSERTAVRLFGDAEKAIGQPIHTLMRASLPPYIVTAVVKDPSPHTNLPFDAIINHNMIQHFSQLPPEAQWSFFVMDLYVKLHPSSDPKAFANQLKELPERIGVNKEIELRTLPIREIRHHLNEDTPFTLNFIGLFVVSGALLLFAALFNFLNSYMDLFRQRVREWRLRTVNGATRKQLIEQMSVELGCSVLASLLVALIFIVQVKPLFARWLEIDLEMGRWWTEGNELSVVLNESAVRAMGLQDPVGSIIRMPWWSDFSVIKEYEIVGVVNDFHALSFRESIHPMLFIPSGGLVNNLYIRVIPDEEGNIAHHITELLPKIDPTLADTRITPIGTLYDQLNQSEIVGLKIFSFLAFACLLISLFGIYAVATASTKRRRKEIAIRKVVGSKASEIIFLFFKEYMRLIVIAGIIAFPISYLVMNYWLQGYAYRIQIQTWWLVGIFITITSMVLGTIREQVCKAANENPSEVIKSQ